MKRNFSFWIFLLATNLLFPFQSAWASFTNKTAELLPTLRGAEPAKAAWGDFNNDGYPDLLAQNKLYVSNQGTSFSVLTGFGPGIWGDHHNDGYLDIYLFRTGSH